jgi:hypothetical protein
MPAINFVAVCANANLPLPTTKARQQTLFKDSGNTSSASLSTTEIKERVASLLWVRHAVANGIPSNTWPLLRAPALLDDVSGLYPIPPAKSGADPGETELHRLAQVSPFSCRTSHLLLLRPLLHKPPAVASIQLVRRALRALPRSLRLSHCRMAPRYQRRHNNLLPVTMRSSAH